MRPDTEKALEKADRTESKKKTDDRDMTRQEVTHIVKPFISSFSRADPVPKKDVCFEDWKLETNYLIKSSPYPDMVINQALRNSLGDQARKVVNTMTKCSDSRNNREVREHIW